MYVLTMMSGDIDLLQTVSLACIEVKSLKKNSHMHKTNYSYGRQWPCGWL